MAKLFVRKCPCLRPKIEEDVKVLDYRHCSLNDVPGEVFNFERTLEELLVDSNQIKDLPRELFYCHGLRKLSLSDNEIKQIPPAIGSLISLENLDLSKNGVIDIPENIKTCKYLQIVDASVNPLGKLPDGFTQLLNLTQLYLNDTFLDYLPGNFGRLSKLKILEIRENHLKTLPKSFSRLVELEKLDLGQNEFSELPDVIGSLSSLLELWCDNNQIQSITPTIGNLKQLMFFDGCKNCLQTLPAEIEGCTSLADLHLTTNQLQSLPDSIGELGNLTTLKADDNCLTTLPHTLGELSALSELNVSANRLQELPSSLGLLRYLRTLYADDNNLEYIPAELGSCSGITVLSIRSNRLSYIPDEIGRIPRLRVLNLSSNQLRCLPFTIVKCKELQALWLSENQTRPLITLQSEHERETGRKILTCYLLPQRPLQDSGDHGGDTDSFHASMWEEERRNRQQIHFEFGDDSDVDGSLIRQPTPYPKEMREKARHLKNLALRQQMSNGVRQGEDNPAYEERRIKASSPSMERLTLINQEGDGVDGRARDTRAHKPGSPSIHDPFTLYKYDKEKLARDKARMQQRHSQQYEHEEEKRSHRKHGSRDNSPAASDRSSRKSKERRSLTNAEDDDDGGFQGPRVSSLGSTPDIPSAMSDRASSTKFTYCSPAELSQNLSHRSDNQKSHSSHGNHPRTHRQRRMRDYDSDTGYRSDQELLKFRRQQQQMYQRANDNYSEIVPVTRPKGRRRDGYSSDLEGYSQRSMGAAYRETSAADTRNYPNRSNSMTRSVTYELNQSPNKSLSQYSQNGAVRNDELYEHSMADPNINHYPSSSPSPLHRRNVIDQSTPMSPSSARTDYKVDPEMDLKKDLFSAQDQHRAEGMVDPENRYMPDTPSQSQGPREDGRPVPPYKPAPPYPSSPGQRKLPHTPNRTSPYGVSLYDKQTRSSPMKDFHQRMPDIQETRDSTTSLNRSRTQLNHRNSDVDLQDYRTSESRSNYLDMQNVPSDSPQTPTSDSANVSRTFMGGPQGDVTSASSKDSGNYSYHDRTLGESPVNVRNSPLSGIQERRGSRNSPLDYVHDPRRNFDRYDNSFREPATVHIPSRYDDIAMYKSDEPPSQVSSSTDSGYGHNLFEKMLESQRFSGNSKGSPSPDHFNSDSNTSSSHHEGIGQYSRGTTPVNHSDTPTREGSNQGQRFERFRVTITKNPGLGFSIAGGKGAYGNPFRQNDWGIFVTKIQPGGPASSTLRRGDKLLEVNGTDFSQIEHTHAVNVLKSTGSTVQLCVERETTS